MKKIIAGVLIVFVLLIGLSVILGVAYSAKVQSEISKMSPLETQLVVEDIYVIKDSYANLFLIAGNDSYIAIDAGNSSENVRQELEKLDIEWQKVIAVFLTHTDTDHISALSVFKNAKVYISQTEEQMINGQTPRFFFFRNTLNDDYELVEDNQVVDISGLRVKGISTPGHTPGSMCYLVNDHYLFVGDTMIVKDGRADAFSDSLSMDSETQRGSIKKLAGLPGVEYVFTAHYGFTHDYEKTFDGWRD